METEGRGPTLRLVAGHVVLGFSIAHGNVTIQGSNNSINLIPHGLFATVYAV